MKTDSFDFQLPDSQIALTPLNQRDRSRLLVLHRDGRIEHRMFHELGSFLHQGDLLIMNNSKVVPVRLTAFKPSGGRLDLLLVKKLSSKSFRVLSRRKYTGRISFNGGNTARLSDGEILTFDDDNAKDIIWKYGKMPLPPYIKREPDERDRNWYQTVYARKEGSIAAPTAGLHFTEELINGLLSEGTLIREITLHVGVGTFRPIHSVDIEKHVMEPEEFEVDPMIPELVKRTRAEGKKVVSVGTTTTRTLEAVTKGHYTGELPEDPKDRGDCPSIIRGSTDLFIYPGYEFQAINGLITNFHLPKSTPLMLVSAFAGRENIIRAYREAIGMGYRFFSYGDAMLIL